MLWPSSQAVYLMQHALRHALQCSLLWWCAHALSGSALPATAVAATATAVGCWTLAYGCMHASVWHSGGAWWWRAGAHIMFPLRVAVMCVRCFCAVGL
jgi:hypothetical protein